MVSSARNRLVYGLEIMRRTGFIVLGFLALLSILTIALIYVQLYTKIHYTYTLPTQTPYVEKSRAYPIETLTNISREIIPKHIRILVLVDNNPNPNTTKCINVWGLSIAIEINGSLILFDTGPSPEVLKHNAIAMGIDLSQVDIVIISHEHSDHYGGIKAVVNANKSVKIYIPADSSTAFKSWIRSLTTNIVEVRKTIEIIENVYVFKEMYGPPYEIALVIATKKGLIVIVGCSHPGIVNMLNEIKEDFNSSIWIVLGGFHTFYLNKQEANELIRKLISLEVEKIAPIHCSGDTIRHLLKQKYPEHYIELAVCRSLNISDTKYHVHDDPAKS